MFHETFSLNFLSVSLLMLLVVMKLLILFSKVLNNLIGKENSVKTMQGILQMQQHEGLPGKETRRKVLGRPFNDDCYLRR